MSIEVKNITHIYSEGLPHQSVAIEDVSFQINDGEFVGIIGHTGSGKSTLLQHLNGLLKPKSGSIIVGDVEITAEGVSMIEIRKKIGLVFQYPEYQLFEETVAKDVAFGPGNLGLPQEEIDQRVREAIELVGLPYEEIKEKSPFELSGGQKRRVAIAGVIAMRPEVLILDEPTAGLDPQAHHDILEMITKLHQTEKMIIILVSHNMNDIARLSHKVLVMERGHLAMMGTPAEVFSKEKELEAMGLQLPDAAKLAAKLRTGGFSLGEEIFTVEALEAELFADLSMKHAGEEKQE
ncbi:MAG: energy-coupling factor transporter ATPase [Anaerovoracaceae bacterium]